MSKAKPIQKYNRNKEDTSDESNQKNNWAVQKEDVTKEEFLSLRSHLFKENRDGDLVLKKDGFFSFLAISYFWYDPAEKDNDKPNGCVRMLRVFLQLKSRKYLGDVEAALGIDNLIEYAYDPVEDDDTAIDAKKAFYSVVGNCQNMAFAGILRTKGAGTKGAVHIGGYIGDWVGEDEKKARNSNQQKVGVSPSRPQREAKNGKKKIIEDDNSSEDGAFGLSSHSSTPIKGMRKRRDYDDDEVSQPDNKKKQKVANEKAELIGLLEDLRNSNNFLVTRVNELSREMNKRKGYNEDGTEKMVESDNEGHYDVPLAAGDEQQQKANNRFQTTTIMEHNTTSTAVATSNIKCDEEEQLYSDSKEHHDQGSVAEQGELKLEHTTTTTSETINNGTALDGDRSDSEDSDTVSRKDMVQKRHEGTVDTPSDQERFTEMNVLQLKEALGRAVSSFNLDLAGRLIDLINSKNN